MIITIIIIITIIRVRSSSTLFTQNLQKLNHYIFYSKMKFSLKNKVRRLVRRKQLITIQAPFITKYFVNYWRLFLSIYLCTKVYYTVRIRYFKLL